MAADLNKPEEAKEMFEKAIETDPENAQVYVNYGIHLAENFDKPEEAKEMFEKAIEINSGNVRAYVNYGILLAEKFSKLEEAKEMFEKAIEIDPENAEIYNSYGISLAENFSKQEEAKEMFERAIEIEPENAEFHYDYGTLLAENFSKPEKAREKYEKSVNLLLQKNEPRLFLRSLRGLVRQNLKLENTVEVIENCDSALDTLDENPYLDSDGSKRLELESMRRLAESSDEGTIDLYRYALRNVEALNPYPALRLFEEVCERRDGHDADSKEYEATISAGVAIAAHLEREGIECIDSSHSVDEILDEIDPEELSGVRKAVYETLHPERETETKPEDIEKTIEQYRGLDMNAKAYEANIFNGMFRQLRQ